MLDSELMLEYVPYKVESEAHKVSLKEGGLDVRCRSSLSKLAAVGAQPSGPIRVESILGNSRRWVLKHSHMLSQMCNS